MLPDKELCEAFRQACCEGNEPMVKNLLSNGVDVNSQNLMNGWTALHWASKRGHGRLVNLLCEAGANAQLPNHEGKTSLDVACNEATFNILNKNDSVKWKPGEINVKSNLDFTPNYLANPVFVHALPQPEKRCAVDSFNTTTDIKRERELSNKSGFLYNPNTILLTGQNIHCPVGYPIEPGELVLKARLHTNQDFIEVGINRTAAVTLKELKEIMLNHFQDELQSYTIKFIRKLPNTILMCDRDVTRLTDYQELEIVPQKIALKP